MSGGTLGRNNDYHLDLFKRGAKIWIKDPERVWTNAELLQDISFNSSTIQVKRLSDGEVCYLALDLAPFCLGNRIRHD